MALAFKAKEPKEAGKPAAEPISESESEADEKEVTAEGFAIKMLKAITPEQVIEILLKEPRERRDAELAGFVPWLKKKSDVFKRLRTGILHSSFFLPSPSPSPWLCKGSSLSALYFSSLLAKVVFHSFLACITIFSVRGY